MNVRFAWLLYTVSALCAIGAATLAFGAVGAFTVAGAYALCAALVLVPTKR